LKDGAATGDGFEDQITCSVLGFGEVGLDEPA
jgi:hypothetical protein